jgi:hypothetical protein
MQGVNAAGNIAEVCQDLLEEPREKVLAKRVSGGARPVLEAVSA